MSEPKDNPLILKLAPLPRNQVGPFLLLGLNKEASKEEVESHWAQRLIWARKGQSAVPLEDINWAREIASDPERRVRADAISLNIDTSDGTLKKLQARFQGKSQEVVGCRPLDQEKSLADYTPAIAVPEIAEIRQGISLPDVPTELPAVRKILEQEARKMIDPWEFRFED